MTKDELEKRYQRALEDVIWEINNADNCPGQGNYGGSVFFFHEAYDAFKAWLIAYQAILLDNARAHKEEMAELAEMIDSFI